MVELGARGRGGVGAYECVMVCVCWSMVHVGAWARAGVWMCAAAESNPHKRASVRDMTQDMRKERTQDMRKPHARVLVVPPS